MKFKTITKINGKSIEEDSVGTKHEKYIENILKINDKKIILLDQPDDDLDSLTIKESLINKFKTHFFDKQWIVVTHDPKIIINADSKNIVLANHNNASDENDKRIFFNINDEDIKNKYYKIIDAEKSYPKVRYKKYEN